MPSQVTGSSDARAERYAQGRSNAVPGLCKGFPELFHSLIVDKFSWIQGRSGGFPMTNRLPRATSLALRANLEREQSRLALVLVALMSLATVTIVFTTQALSHQHEHQISVERPR